MSMITERLPVADGQSIVVDWRAPAEPGGRCAAFIHGLASDRKGEKAQYFSEAFAAMGWGFLAVDLRGHGEADGTLEELTLSRCLDDLHTALQWIPQPAAPPLLIGSSMGAAVSAWYAAGGRGPVGPLVLLAPSLRFPGHFLTALPQAELDAWRSSGKRRLESAWIDIDLGYGLLEDARNYPPEALVQRYDHPTLIIQGMQDDAVDWHIPLEFTAESPCATIDLLLIKQGDHRLTDYKAYLWDAIQGWLRRGW